MIENDNFLSTRKLLTQLNWFIGHIAVYFLANIALILIIYQNVTSRWPLLFFVLLWAVAIIYHAHSIYRSGKQKKGSLKLA